MFKKPEVPINVDTEKIRREIREIVERLDTLETKMDSPFTAEKAKALSNKRDKNIRDSWDRDIEPFFEECLKRIKKACTEGEFGQSRVVFRYAPEDKYRYIANEVRKRLIGMGYKVTGESDAMGGWLRISW